MKMIILITVIFFQNILLQPLSKNKDQAFSILNNALKKDFTKIHKVYSPYGPWTKVSCYKGIQFRTLRSSKSEEDGTYWWSVPFRNLYNKEVGFRYNIVEPEKEAITKKERNTLDFMRLIANENPDDNPNNPDNPHAGNYIRSADNLFMYIIDVRFWNNDKWDDTVIKCDY